MKTIGFFVVLSFFMTVVCGPRLHAASTNPNPVGHWKGSIVLPTTPLEIAVDISLSGDQSLQGTIDIPAQGLRRFALGEVKAERNTLSFAMPGVPGAPVFTGSLSDD